MRRNSFLLTSYCEKRWDIFLLLYSVKNCFPFIFCLLLILLKGVQANSQNAGAGIKVNGKAINGGDTVRICIGGKIQYEASSFNSTNIKWTFKNGTPTSSNLNSVIVEYNSAGIDSTLQTIASNNDTSSTFIIIKVSDQKVVPAFTFSPNGECGNVPIAFSSSGSIGSGLSYQWNFNDGSTSTAANPSYQFLNAIGSSGTQDYNVKLIVTSDQGCFDSISKIVSVKKIPDASLNNPDFPNVDTINYMGVTTFRRCVTTPGYVFKFQNASSTTTINIKYTINWGDGSDTTFSVWTAGTSISHPYTIGQHQMTVTIEGSSGCIGIRKYNIFLGTNPAGGFASPGNTNICTQNALNFIISGYSNNAPGTTYTILTNDGTPSVSFSHPPPDTVSHIFINGSCGNSSSNGFQNYANAFSSTLIIQNPCDATSVGVIPIYVSGKPRPNISVYPSNNVCTNYPVYIANSSISAGTITTTGGGNSNCSYTNKQVWTISPSTGYNITTGSLGSLNGSANNTLSWTSGSSYIYVNFTNPGLYVVKMYVGTDRCGYDSITTTICVRNPPKASFTMNKKSSCGIDTAMFTNTSPVGGCQGDNYNWSVAYSDPSNCSTGTGSSSSFVNNTTTTSKDPYIRFSKPGRYIITLTVSANNTSFTCQPGKFTDTFYVKDKPKSKINPINAVCVGNTISPTAAVANCYGTDPLTYAWTFNNGSPSSSTLLVPGAVMYNSIGSHQVILDVTNECGVTHDTAYASITSTPTANAGQDSILCSGVPVKIGSTAIPGYSYQWKPSTGLSSSTAANPTATLTYSGPNNDTTLTYVVTVSAGQNCSSTDTTILTVKKKPVVIVTPSTAQVCAGAGATLVASGADTYVWIPATGLDNTTTNTVIASPASNATYTVAGTANGCSSTATASVTVIPFPTVSAGADTTVCNTSNTVRLTGSPARGTWSGSAFITAAGVFDSKSAGNGSYKLAYSVSNGNCTRTDTVVVDVIDPPVANAGNDTIVCQGTTAISLSGLPVGGRWTGSTFIDASGVFAPTTAGRYTLIYSIGAGTCVGSDTMIITVAGGVTNNTISNDQSICTGVQPATITGQLATGGNGTANYQWQSSPDNITWQDIVGATSKDYTPGVLTQTIFFKRIASTTLCSGSQSNISNVIKITVNPNAKATFNPSISKGCVPFVITPGIINLVPDNNNISEYRWFVNGSYIGSGQNFPGYTMNNAGDSITIKLVTISKFGCKNDSTAHGFITVARPVPSFTQTITDACGPVAVTFTNTTPNASRYTFIWNFGQGQTTTSQQPPVITFPTNPNSGDTIYTVTIKAVSSCDTITSTSFVKVKSKPKVLFTPDRSEGCSPMRVTFSNTSRGNNASYVWVFGDGTAPVFSNNATVQHTFTVGVKQTFYVKLKGTNECGSDSLTYAIVVNPNSIRLDFAVNGNERFGCAPHTVSFINNTTGANSFTWNFGDGNTLNTSKGIDTVVHTFTASGDFTVNLLAANACNDTSDVEMITVALKPNVTFTASSLNTCITDPIRFTNTSDPGIVNRWTFGDATSSSVRNPVKSYSVAGNYKVWLTGSRVVAQGLSCSDSTYADIVIRDTLAGKILLSDSIGSCTPFTVLLKNGNLASSQATWTFGDGTIASGDSVSHTYTASGNYNVVMYSKGNTGCTFKSNNSIIVTAPGGALTYKGGFVCPGNSTKFEVRATNTSRYRFIFGDGDSLITTNSTVFHQYTKPGKYVPFAYLEAGNCLIKVFTGDTIKVESIRAGFKISPQYTCASTTIQFTDTSFAYFGLKTRQWNFGDGTTSTLSNPIKTFNQSGTTYVRLIVASESGCTDTVTIPVTIAVRNFPVSSIRADSVGCTGQPLAVSALVVSNDTIARYSWNFGNNATASGVNATTVYNSPGIYTIRLITSTIYGCADTVYKVVNIRPSPNINAGADVRICKGQSIQLQAAGASGWQWSPLQHLSCITCANPVANPAVTTTYVAKGTNNFGCSVSDTLIVNVVQPVDVTVSGNDTICIDQQTQLFAAGASNYAWSPASGLSSSTIANPIAKPATTTQYMVIGSDQYKCFSDTAYVTVAVGSYPTVNLGSGALVVAGTPVVMDPILTNGPFLNYTWTPVQNLSCTNCPKPIATINTNITYKLEVENVYGCMASDTISYTVQCEEASQLFVPNAFSPDNDGLNDVLMVRGKGLASVKYFRIFNRWGQLVFEKNNFNPNDPNHGWDGKVNGVPANPEVYVYTAEVVCTAGGVFVKKGNVTLFR
jgi:gliding motility-associated-like protein